MNLADLLCYIQKELIGLRATLNPDINNSQRLWDVMGIIVGTLEENQLYGNPEATKIIYHLYDSAMDSVQGTYWKSYIPTLEEIRAAFESEK